MQKQNPIDILIAEGDFLLNKILTRKKELLILMSNMARKYNDPDNFQKYQNRIKEIPSNLPVPDHVETLDELIAEGERLLKLDEKKAKSMPDERKRLDSTLEEKSPNPYIRARAMILKKLPPANRKQILDMEASGNTDNHQYTTFVKKVVKLGDSLS